MALAHVQGNRVISYPSTILSGTGASEQSLVMTGHTDRCLEKTRAHVEALYLLHILKAERWPSGSRGL